MRTPHKQIKRPLSKTKQFLLMLAEHVGSNLCDLIDLSIAQLSPRDRRLLMHGGVDRVREQWAREEQRSQKMLLTRLRERKWIEERKIGKDVCIVLTDQGRTVVLKERMRMAPACQNNECIIVIFDVPEQERATRQQFRYFLKACSFTQLQKSVWVHDCDVLTAIQDFIKVTKSDHWIQVFRARDVTRKVMR